VARLIKTEKEVEGRYSEQWVVVEGDDDALDQWPQGPGAVVGKPATRQDGRQRARGEAIYTADLQLPGMLYAAVLRSPHARARVKKVDLSPALELPGVLGAIGPDDCHVLQTEPGYHGAPVAAVAADSFARAREALATIEVDWEELEPLLDPEEAVRRESFVSDPRRYDRGDVEAGFAQADVIVEAEYRTQTVLHNSMETHQSVCRWEGDTLEVYISTQFIWGVRASIAEQLELPADRVRVVCEYMGGGFGSKNNPGDYTYIAIALAGKTGRPVRCALTRREENLATGNRNATIQRLRAGARSDGTLVALDAEYVNAVGWTGWSGPTYGPLEMLYACDNVRTLTYGAKLNLPPNAAFRAPGFVEGTYGLECLLDELAARLELDPLELRRRNHARSRRRSSSSATTAPRSTGRAATRCGLARKAPCAAAPGSRARSGTAAVGRPPTRACE
jgi:CO/xanthine dehydrogenase Mo-binding subunit